MLEPVLNLSENPEGQLRHLEISALEQVKQELLQGLHSPIDK